MELLATLGLVKEIREAQLETLVLWLVAVQLC